MLASLDRMYDLDGITVEVTSRLQSLLQHLIKEHAAEDAWRIASRLVWSLGIREPSLERVIVDLIQSEVLPEYQRPSIQQEYAKYLMSIGRREDGKEAFTTARDAFESMKHPYGGLMVLLHLLLEPLFRVISIAIGPKYINS
jgi:hypothetical protein